MDYNYKCDHNLKKNYFQYIIILRVGCKLRLEHVHWYASRKGTIYIFHQQIDTANSGTTETITILRHCSIGWQIILL